MQSLTQSQWLGHYPVTSLLSDFQGQLGFYALLQVLQDTAVHHALELNLGREVMRAQNLFWVLVRQKVEMQRYPQLGETLLTRTWLRAQEDGQVLREFELTNEKGEACGQATTLWLTLNADTRRVVKIDAHQLLRGLARDESTGLEAVRVRPEAPFTERFRLTVRNSDIDGNLHTNNTRYGQWAWDALPLAALQGHQVSGYEVNFLAETRPGDVISLEEAVPSDWRALRGVRESDQKVVFTARLRLAPLPSKE